MNTFPSLFDIVAAELRTLGLTLRSLPGEYCVNFRYGSEKTARFAESLDEALPHHPVTGDDNVIRHSPSVSPLR